MDQASALVSAWALGIKLFRCDGESGRISAGSLHSRLFPFALKARDSIAQEFASLVPYCAAASKAFCAAPFIEECLIVIEYNFPPRTLVWLSGSGMQWKILWQERKMSQMRRIDIAPPKAGVKEFYRA